MKQRKHWYHFAVIAALLLTAIGPYMNFSSALAANQPAEAASSLKLLVDSADIATLKDLAASGAVLQADYQSFSVWKIAGNQRSSFASRPSVTVRDDFYTISLRDSVIDTRKTVDESVAPAERQGRTNESQLWLVQFVGPIQDLWLDSVSKLGLEPVIYMPENAYLVWGDGAALARLDSLQAQGTSIQWAGPYHPAYRLAPELKNLDGTTANSAAKNGRSNVTVQFITTDSTKQSLAKLETFGGKVYKSPSQSLKFTNVTLEVPSSRVAEIATWPDVYNVEHWGQPEKMDEAQGVIMSGNLTTSGANVVPAAPGYLAFLAAKGFPTTQSSYPVVDVVDDGLDRGDGANLAHPDFHELGLAANPDRVPFIGNCTVDTNGNAVGGHGNLNAGIVGAYNNLTGSPHVDANGYRLGLGISPYGRVAGTKIFANSGAYDISACSNTDQGVVASTFNAGATMTSNSWGCGPPNCGPGGVYDASSQAYDSLTRDASSTTAGNQQMLHVFSAGNSGSGATTLGTPGTAKNVITVGATENVRDQGVLDGCSYGEGNNADDMASFSSRGPTTDQRVKPDIVAPGTHVQGPASQDAGFDGTGVCGPASGLFYPTGQTLYTWSTGTSHSAPAVAGTASLVYEYYGRVLKPGNTPSPAMIKGLILNTPRYLAAPAAGAGGNLPTSNQGWGDVNLGNIFDGVARKLNDQDHVFGATGESMTYNGVIANPSKPFHVSLVWTDAAGTTTGNSYVNNLDLEVTVGGQTYKGNVFNGANSTTGGTADVRNNVEGVFLPAGTTGPYTVRVIATNIAGDAIPGNADTTDQDYALVVYNAGTGNPNLRTVAWSTASQSVSETVGNVTLTASITATYTATISLQFATSGTATNPADHNLPVSGTITIPAGQLSGSTTFQVVNDTLDESNETVVASISGATNANIGDPSTHTVTIVDDELPLVSFGVSSASTQVVSYTGAPVAIPDATAAGVNTTLTVSGFSGNMTDLDFYIGGTSCSATIGSTTVGVDHTWVGDLKFTLTSPEGTAVTIIDRPGAGTNGSNGNNFCKTLLDDDGSFPPIDTIDDDTPTTPLVAPYTGTFMPQNALSAFDGENPNGVWTLNVSDNAGQDTGTLRAFSLKITAGGFQPQASQTVSELAGQATVSVGLSAPAETAVNVPFTVSGTATNPADHNLGNGTITIPIGETTASTTFNIVNDAVTEGTETVILTMGTPTGATPGSPAVHTVNIVDGGSNTPPASAAGGNLTVQQQGGPVSGTVATVSDSESPASALTVAVSGAPNGLTVSVVNNNGTVTATAEATCDVPTGDYTITVTVTDPGNLTATSTFTVTVTAATSTDSITDGSFEGGTPNAAWDEASTNFGTPLCDAACGTGGGAVGPRTGTWYAWFGGSANAESGSLTQVVNVPSGASLEFYIRYGRHTGNGASDTFKVTANGTEIFAIDDTTTTYDGTGYTRVEISLADYANQSVTLVFAQHNEAATATTVPAINIDDVAVLGPNPCEAPTHGTAVSASDPTQSGAPNANVSYTVTVTNTGSTTDTFDLSLGTHVWTSTLGSATVGPLAPGASANVTVTVTVPAAATNGQTDSVTVTATSQADNSVSNSVTLTTTADVTTPTEYNAFLPVIIR